MTPLLLTPLVWLRSANAWMIAGLAGLVVTLATCDMARLKAARKQGAAELAVNLDKDAKEKADAAREAREPARRPGAAERLRSRAHCRDC